MILHYKSLNLVPVEEFINQRVAKYFGEGLNFGSVLFKFANTKGHDENNLWRIIYDDGGKEDLVRGELVEARQLYQKNAHKDTNATYKR